MDILSAVNAPRFHHQWKPEYISMETELYSDSINTVLNNMGHIIKTRTNIGNVNAIMFQNNSVTVGADKRGDNKSEVIYDLNSAP